MRIFLFIIVGLSLFSSCASRKDLVYFQPDSTALNSSFNINAPTLKPGDILTISVSADDEKAALPFNQIGAYQNGVFQNTSLFVPTYTIDANGDINFPKLGNIKLAGLTRVGAINLLKSKISQYIIDPGVNINIQNFRITVLGEVVRPGAFPVQNDRITILEALGMAGDLTINGVRKNVLVIREEDGVKKEYRVDLTKRDALNSPVYYLAQNDVIYVEPNGARVQSSKYTQNTSVFVSIASLIITIVAVIVR
ncbi:polysaccharide biosynthesis/export family protein [Sphingobacterium daejeonense]|uniref:polysaccharide biosynthesis/export family protein n=1 Tax=Sphingobacterium daejeonense TaxID=371142 RepID=UPI0010C2BEAC|nr:polysaccharide biosynthesis/export family protein [Sphingobacterium daejeonense]VTQ07296.1 polysaccharide export protein Wza [Sphingobacterium daejeonense]